MKRRIISLLLAALTALSLCGCGGRTAPVQENDNVIPTAPKTYANPFGPEEKDRSWVILSDAFGQEIYPNSSWWPCLELWVLSKEALDVGDVSVTMDIQTPYEIVCDEFPVSRKLDEWQGDNMYDFLDGDFPYYLYQCYRGTDWEKLRTLLKAALEEDPELGSDPYEEAGEAVTAYKEYLGKFWEDYRSLTPADLPTFHLYRLDIYLGFVDHQFVGNVACDETCDRIEVHLDTIDTVLTGGSFTIHSETLVKSWEGGLRQKTWGCVGYTAPCFDGYVRCDGIVQLVAEQDAVLQRYRFQGGGLELVKARLRIGDSEESASLDFMWDGESPMYIAAGSYISMDVILYDPAAAEHPSYDYARRAYGLLEYTFDGKEGKIDTECLVHNQHNPWEAYAVWFDGVDVSGFYRNYYQSPFSCEGGEFPSEVSMP